MASRIAQLEHDVHDILSNPLPQPSGDTNGNGHMQRKLSFRAASLKLKRGKDSSASPQPTSSASTGTPQGAVPLKAAAVAKPSSLQAATTASPQPARKPLPLSSSNERGSVSSVLDEASAMETKSLTKQNSIQQLIVTAGGDGAGIARGQSLVAFDLDSSNTSNPFADEDSDNADSNDGNDSNDNANDNDDVARNYIEVNASEPSALAAIVLGEDSSVLSGTLPVLSADPIAAVVQTASAIDSAAQAPAATKTAAVGAVSAAVQSSFATETPADTVAANRESPSPVAPEAEETVDPVLLLMAALGGGNTTTDGADTADTADITHVDHPLSDDDDEPAPAPPSDDERRPSMPRLFSSPGGSRSSSLDNLASRVAAKVQAASAQGSPLGGSPVSGTSPQDSPTTSPPRKPSNLGQLDFAPVAKVQRAQRAVVSKDPEGREPEDEDVCRLMPSEA